MALRAVGVRLAAEVSGYINSIRTAQRATRDFAGTLREAAARGDLNAVADQAGRMGLALAGVAGVTSVSRPGLTQPCPASGRVRRRRRPPSAAFALSRAVSAIE